MAKKGSKVYGATKDNLESITINEHDNTMTIKWWTGGHENAICGVILKVEVLDQIISGYKAPHIPYDPDYDNPF